MAKQLFLLLILLGLLNSTNAQITGKLTEVSGQPIPFATVSLLNAADSTLLRSSLTTATGDYLLDNILPGKYILRLSSIGYQTWSSAVFALTLTQKRKDFGTQVMKANQQQLGEIVIRGNKPLFQPRTDGMIVNVESSILSKGSTVLEVLERSPGVIIDHQHNGILLNGKSGVMLMINGKSMRMPLEQVVTLLGGMSANDISSIELLTSPSAVYDGEGSGGLINIVLKKNKAQGTNGAFSLTTGYGYGEKGTGSIQLNHNTGESNIYGSYTYTHDKTYSDFHAIGSEQEPLLGGLATSDVLSTATGIVNNHNATVGIDAKLNTTTSIGGSVNYNNSSTALQTINQGLYLIQPEAIYHLNATINGVNHWRNIISNVYIEKQGRPGEKMNLDMDYINYKNDYPIDVQSSFLDKNGQQAGTNDTLFSPRQKGISNTLIQVGAAKLDYAKQLHSKLVLETGMKGTYTQTSSVSAIQSFVNGAFVSRPSAINNIIMREGIGAAYVSLKATLDTATTLVAGLRYEYSNTRMNDQQNKQNITSRKLGVLFPNIMISRKLPNDGELFLSYTKRISRPSYSDLASFVTYNGPSSINTGNPLLKPTITNNVKLGYNYSRYSFSVLLSRDDAPIARYQTVYTPDKMQMAVSPQNLIYQNSVALQADLPFTISSWWEMNYHLVGEWRQFKLDYTPQPAEKTYFTYVLQSSQLFKLPRKYAVELSGYYNAAFYNGSRKVNGYGVLSAGIKKELKNNGGSFQLTVSDLLRSNVISGYFGSLTTEAFDLKTYVRFHPESSKYLLIRLSYARSFGSTSATSKRKRDNGLKDERERMSN